MNLTRKPLTSVAISSDATTPGVRGLPTADHGETVTAGESPPPVARRTPPLRGVSALGILALIAVLVPSSTSAGSAHPHATTTAAAGAALPTVSGPPSVDLPERVPLLQRVQLLTGAAYAWSRLSLFVVWNLAVRSYAGDSEYFANDRWHSADPVCVPCSLGPAVLAATLAGTANDATSRLLRSVAIASFDAAIASYQQPDGSFADPTATTPNNEISTIFFGEALGPAFMELRSVLSPAQRARWAATLVAEANYLITDENALTYYVNGNINLQITELLYYAWRASRSPTLRVAYDASWRFTVNPPAARWPGFGLHLVRGPRHADGSDGSGFLAESGGSTPGADVDYAQLQADVATRLYLYSRDPRALRLANLLVNFLLSHRIGTWLLDTAGGTRHPQPGRAIPFDSAAIAALAWDGHRADLLRYVSTQLDRLREDTCSNLGYSYHNLYRLLAEDTAVVLKAAVLAGPRVARAAYTAERSLCPNLSSPLDRELAQ